MIEEDYVLDNEDNIKKILRELPIKIKEKEENIMNIEVKKEESILKNKIIENDIAIEVANEKEDDKKKYSNKELREVETKKRLSGSLEYRSNAKIIEECIKITNIAKIELSYFKRLCKSAGDIALLGV